MSQNESEPDFFANINKIVNYFARTSKGGFLFCSCNNSPVIKQITETVIKRAADKNLKIFELYLNEEAADSFLYKVRAAAAEKPKGVIISNLDELIVLTKDQIIKDINLSRDILLKLNLPFLFCVSGENISKFANQASDLFLRRDRGVIRFPDIPESTTTNELKNVFPMEFQKSIDFKSLNLKIGLLEKQLNEAEEKKYRPDRIANEIALDLIEVYLDASLLKKANELFKKYETYFNLKDHLKTIKIVADIYFKNSEWDNALEYLSKAKTIVEMTGDTRELTWILLNIGVIYYKKSESDKANEYFLKSKKISEREGNSSGIGRSIIIFGAMHQNKNEWDKALEFYLKGVEILTATGNMDALDVIYYYIGEIYRLKDEWNKAYDYYVKSKELLEKTGDVVYLERVLENIEEVKKHITTEKPS